jgi:hypothetical protein
MHATKPLEYQIPTIRIRTGYYLLQIHPGNVGSLLWKMTPKNARKFKTEMKNPGKNTHSLHMHKGQRIDDNFPYIQ